MASEEVNQLISKARSAQSKFDFEASFELYKEALERLKKESGPLQEKKVWLEIYKGIIDSLDNSGKWLEACRPISHRNRQGFI